MNIEKIDILEWHFTPYCELKTEGLCHVKALPYLSVVQSIEGYYEVKMDNSPIYQTSEKGFLLPRHLQCRILHIIYPQKREGC